MMRGIAWATISLAAAGLAAAAAPRNSLHYQLDGIMSGPVDLHIDLNSGRYALEEDRPPKSGRSFRAAGVLAPAAVARIRTLADTASGRLETDACRRSRTPVPPVADAIRTLALVLHGRRQDAPDSVLCWSEAADALIDGAYRAVRAASSQPLVR